MIGTTLLNRSQTITNSKRGKRQVINSRVFGKKLGLISRIIGCPHKDLSRPFAEGNTGYRTCLSCGARKQFDLETFETYRSFYCPPVIE